MRRVAFIITALSLLFLASASQAQARRFTSGLDIQQAGDRIIVVDVATGSAADQAGFKVGDVLVTVRGGESAWGWLGSVGGQLYHGKRGERVTVSRGGKLLKLKLRQGESRNWSAKPNMAAAAKLSADGYHVLGIGIGLGPWVGDGRFVERVVAKGPAARAGVKVGDKVVAISNSSTWLKGGWSKLIRAFVDGRIAVKGTPVKLKLVGADGRVRRASPRLAIVFDDLGPIPCRFRAQRLELALPSDCGRASVKQCARALERLTDSAKGLKQACSSDPAARTALTAYQAANQRLQQRQALPELSKAATALETALKKPNDARFVELAKQYDALAARATPVLAGAKGTRQGYFASGIQQRLTRMGKGVETRRAAMKKLDALRLTSVAFRQGAAKAQSHSPAAVAQAWNKASADMLVVVTGRMAFAPGVRHRPMSGAGTVGLVWNTTSFRRRYATRRIHEADHNTVVLVTADGGRFEVAFDGVRPWKKGDAIVSSQRAKDALLDRLDLNALGAAGVISAKTAAKQQKLDDKAKSCEGRMRDAAEAKEGKINRSNLRWHTKKARIDALWDKVDVNVDKKCYGKASIAVLNKATKSYRKARAKAAKATRKAVAALR